MSTTKLTSFHADIRPLFTERDIQGMIKGFNLASYDDVKAHAAAIYDRIRGIGGAVMPPPPPGGKVHGPRLALSYSQSGCRTGTNRRRSHLLMPVDTCGPFLVKEDVCQMRKQEEPPVRVEQCSS